MFVIGAIYQNIEDGTLAMPVKDINSKEVSLVFIEDGTQYVCNLSDASLIYDMVAVDLPTYISDIALNKILGGI